jgi:hypothetical protein
MWEGYDRSFECSLRRQKRFAIILGTSFGTMSSGPSCGSVWLVHAHCVSFLQCSSLTICTHPLLLWLASTTENCSFLYRLTFQLDFLKNGSHCESTSTMTLKQVAKLWEEGAIFFAMLCYCTKSVRNLNPNLWVSDPQVARSKAAKEN